MRYFAGPNPDALADVRSRGIADRQPDSWMLMNLDLAQDFGEGQLTSLTLLCPDGDYALLDHVYLARNPGDFGRCPPPAGNGR